jgi:hypothetical protein
MATTPDDLLIYTFSGQATTSTKYVGASGAPWLSGVTITVVPDMPKGGLVVSWEIINNEASGGNDLLVRPGPKGESFVPAAGNVLSNYLTLKPGFSYSWNVWALEEQINEARQGLDYSLLLVESSTGTADFSGVVTVYAPGS